MTSVHRIAYIGNYQPGVRNPWSTETHVKQALESNGHQVVPWQENEIDWRTLGRMAADDGIDFVMWTRTWHLDVEAQLVGLAQLTEAGVPTVGYHLDRWWGLEREHQVKDEPFFRQTVVCTADGGHDDQWADAGVNHRWFPPAVLGAEAGQLGTSQPELEADVCFVGSHQQYHQEWAYRMDLIRWLQVQYGRNGRLGLWPQGGQAIRGARLADLYRSVKVVVGDSCLAGNAEKYFSDRIPETLGRGGFLIHPWVEGLDAHYTPDEHLVCYELGDWSTLRRLVDLYIGEPEERARIADAGRAHVLANHTYEIRMAQLVEMLHTGQIVTHPDFVHDDRDRIVVQGPLRASFRERAGSDDALVVNEVWRENTYRLTPADVAGRVVVDIGANIGAFTVWALRAGAVQVNAYEPDPTNFGVLLRNVASPHCDGMDVRCDPVAVIGDMAVSVQLMLAGASSRVTPAHWTPTEVPLEVQAVSIEEVIATAGTGLVLKLDCEGSEYSIVDGIESWDRIDRIVMEWHGPGMLGEDPDDWEDFEFGGMVERLAEHGHVEILGRPTVGGMLWWRRYE